jgi:spermidine synthase
MVANLDTQTWLTDGDKNIAFSIRHQGKRLFQQQSPYQLVEVFESYAYGRVLTVDGLVMCTEADEHAYHEMIVHVPMLAHRQVRKVLVIGGGDGGTVREILRHPKVESVTLVEIDAVVIEASRQYLPTLSSTLNHEKLNLLIGDGIEYIQQASDETFDLIIVDSSDPIGPAQGLFNKDFFLQVKRCLRPNGLMTAQSESPWFHSESLTDLTHCLRSIFEGDRVHPYLVFIPTYPTGMWSFIYAAKGDIHPWQNLDRAQAQAFAERESLQYYNADVHLAAFSLPTFVRKLLSA